MAKDKLDELEQKKKELEDELDRIQDELDDSIDRVRTDVTSRLDPVTFIKKHPLPVVGVSVLLGFLAGHGSGKNRSGSGASGSGSTSMIWNELKKLATKKALSLASHYMEQKLAGDKSSKGSNAPAENSSPPEDR